MNVSQMRASLVILAVTAGISTFSATSAFAYARHEHPFRSNMSFSGTDQARADVLCRQILDQAFRRTPWFVVALNGTWLYKNKVRHVWAHLNNKQCIANQ
jgi:hypothetical protein